MKRLQKFLLVLCSCVQLAPVNAATRSDSTRTVAVVNINGPISPFTAEYILAAIEEATQAQHEALVIALDTPGGLLESTRLITKAMLASEVPVIVYVSPQGARAASAGVFITYAAHVAAMAPSTNIGAAHPVNLGARNLADSSSTMMEKITNDAVAQIKAVAEKRGRNAAWAEDAVRKSVSITETEARALHVIEFIAPSLDSLLHAIDGLEVELVNRKTKLATAHARLVTQEMNWRHKLLERISDPNIAYILMLLGIYGLFFELWNPGAVLPGVIGGICLILGLYAMQTLPVNWAGFALILFAIILFLLEIKITSYGVLSIGGVIALLLGSLMLFKEPSGEFEPVVRISKQLILAATIVSAAFFSFVIGMSVRSQRKPAVTGAEGMIGEIGVALTELSRDGRVRMHGEIWHGYSDAPIASGERVRVIAVEGLQLKVEKC